MAFQSMNGTGVRVRHHFRFLLEGSDEASAQRDYQCADWCDLIAIMPHSSVSFSLTRFSLSGPSKQPRQEHQNSFFHILSQAGLAFTPNGVICGEQKRPCVYRLPLKADGSPFDDRRCEQLTPKCSAKAAHGRQPHRDLPHGPAANF